ncbi:MAG: alpha/beta fold hydrolase [Alphaproteobacteria bacterium]|nr:alpha/beta fold hydrolase [Alphaproteobacteria bacterium]
MENVKLLSNYDNLEISVVVKHPKGVPKAVIQLVHGMSGCKERFRPLMTYLSDNGIVCIASDLRGHGESVKDVRDLGYFYSGGYKALVDDLRLVKKWGKKEFSGLPYYLLGHSMGSLAARVYVKQDDSDLSGLILCGSPSWNSLSIGGKFLMGTLCKLGFERVRPKFFHLLTSGIYNLKFASEGEQAWTCSDSKMRAKFRKHPRCNFRFTMNGAYNLMKMMGETYSLKGWNVLNPQMPVLFISGDDDPCMISKDKFYDAVSLMNKVGYENVKSLIFPKMRHEVLNEIGKRKVWEEILYFIENSTR